MGLPSLLSSTEFLHFKAILKIGNREAYGYLDYSWLLFNLSGNPIYPDAAYLEAILEWPGKAGQLAAAMLKAGFLIQGKKGSLAIANPETRLQDWGRKRMLRASAEQPPLSTERRITARNRRPTDPDPVSSSPRLRVLTPDNDHEPPVDRDRPKTPRPGGGKSSKNPQEAAQELLRAATAGVKEVQGRPTRPGAPGPQVPIGAYTAKDCALAAAALDTRHDDDTARAMWITRAAELSMLPGGLDYFRDLLATIHQARHCGALKGVGKIHNPGAYLNAKTAAYLEQRRSA